MANAKQCDICGKFYAAHKLSKQLRGYGVSDTATITIFDPDPNASYPGEVDQTPETMEACSECIKKIRDFIESMKVAK
jgi:hypothetical protein